MIYMTENVCYSYCLVYSLLFQNDAEIILLVFMKIFTVRTFSNYILSNAAHLPKNPVNVTAVIF